MGLITVDVKDRKLIYEQLIDNIKDLILEGLLRPEEFLPSVRSLAKELGINPNTIQKAYAELERQNVIVSLPGRGSMVTSDIEVVKALFRKKIERKILSTVSDAKRMKMTQEEYLKITDECWNRKTEAE